MSDLDILITKKWQKILADYELVKRKRHPHFSTCKELYAYHDTSAKQVLKYYHRYLSSGKATESLLPRKRGPRFVPHKTPKHIERSLVSAHRRTGANRYELVRMFTPKYGAQTPAPSTAYAIVKRYQRGLRKKEKEAIKRYEKRYPGELAHADAHYLPLKTLRELGVRQGFLAALNDDCTRLTYAEYIPNLKAGTMAGFLMRAFSFFYVGYGIRFERILTDNGSEFLGKETQFILSQLKMKHSRTLPYRPQTNGKIEAFWKILEREMVQPNTYTSLPEFEHTLEHYIIHFNNYRRHGGLKYTTPWNKYLSTHKIVTEILD